MNPLQVECELLTPLRTAGMDTRLPMGDRLHETGLLGGIRWWYEALVRGLDGYACDPTAPEPGQRCQFKGEAYERVRQAGLGAEAIRAGLQNVCPTCCLFGCTGWSRKFRLTVTGTGQAGKRVQLTFDPIKPMGPEEVWLLRTTLQLIADYGSIGSRTTWKPQQHPRLGQDYGLIKLVKVQMPVAVLRPAMQRWVAEHKPPRDANSRWPDLRYFFFGKGTFLWRRQINELIGLSEDGKRVVHNGELEQALRGAVGNSKKVFSFRADGGRVWGYVPDKPLLEQAIQRLVALGIPPTAIQTGQEVLNAL